jgi:bisphosphoglycerate-independent phosphoglycerate mutase (AlkP superfamily)
MPESLYNLCDLPDGLVVISADHGNLEDLAHKHHTLNKVPTFVIGDARTDFARELTDLSGLTPAILRFLAG